jgi:hypothetical protein
MVVKRVSTLAAAFIVVSCSALAGIEFGTPLVSGDVATLEDRHETSRRELSQPQVQALSRWLDRHKSGWHGMITESSSEPRCLQFLLKDADGKLGSIEVVAGVHGDYLQFHSSSEQWSYRSLGGLFKSWAGTRALSLEELNQLEQAVGLSSTLDRWCR